MATESTIRRVAAGLLAAGLLAGLGPGSTLAATTGCAADASGWTLMSVEATAARIWPGLLDPSPWPGGLPDFVEQIDTEDGNDDGSVCLMVRWGESVDPHAHWYRVGIELIGSPTELFIVRDNTGR